VRVAVTRADLVAQQAKLDDVTIVLAQGCWSGRARWISTLV
jgi:hypothetical protein